MNYNEFCNKYKLNPNPEQEAAIKRIDGPTLLVAVPGSGKTTVIISRIAYMIFCCNIKPEKILTLTFSVDAAKSMRSKYIKTFVKLHEKGSCIPEFRTIHSLSFNIIRSYCRLYGKTPFSIVKNSDSIINLILKNLGYEIRNDTILKDIIVNISKSKNLLYTKDEIKEIIIKKIDFYKVFEAYENYKHKNRLMDFDDMLIYASRILRKYPDVLSLYQERFDYFNVDEAQDNSLIQDSIMKSLSSHKNNLFMVGDEDQCIYGFRGANPSSFTEFGKQWGEDNVLKLQTNYRSHDEILEISEKFISLNPDRITKKLSGVKGRGALIEIKTFSNVNERNEYIFMDSENYDSSAVLARNNDSLITLIHKFTTDDFSFETQNKYNLKGGKNDFFESFPIKDILFLLKESLNLNSTPFPKHLDFLADERNQISFLKNLSPVNSIYFILLNLKYIRYLKAKHYDGFSFESFNSKLNTLINMANSTTCINELIKKLEMINNICISGSSGGNISFLTCHGSKGLEFNKIYLIDVIDKIFPMCNNIETCDSTTGRQISTDFYEERRLFYVALTRAMEKVEILNVKSLAYGESQPSIFVRETEIFLRGNTK